MTTFSLAFILVAFVQMALVWPIIVPGINRADVVPRRLLN